jgi:hypothetical protein
MKTRSYLLFVALSSLMAACNPIIRGGGTGGAGAEGGSGGMGGMGGSCDGAGGFGAGGDTGTGGGTYDPCAGLSCGDGCSLCGPDDTCLPAETFCNANGQCQAGPPVCGPVECSSNSDCIYNGPCDLCPDGSTACPTAACVDGQCAMSDPGCAPPPPPPAPCSTNADCLTTAQPEVCQVCSDGSDACAENVCVAGQCQTVFPPCPQD